MRTQPTTTTLTIRLPTGHVEALAAEAERRKTSAAQVMREIVSTHLSKSASDSRIEITESRIMAKLDGLESLLKTFEVE